MWKIPHDTVPNLNCLASGCLRVSYVCLLDKQIRFGVVFVGPDRGKGVVVNVGVSIGRRTVTSTLVGDNSLRHRSYNYKLSCRRSRTRRLRRLVNVALSMVTVFNTTNLHRLTLRTGRLTSRRRFHTTTTRTGTRTRGTIDRTRLSRCSRLTLVDTMKDINKSLSTCSVTGTLITEGVCAIPRVVHLSERRLERLLSWGQLDRRYNRKHEFLTFFGKDRRGNFTVRITRGRTFLSRPYLCVRLYGGTRHDHITIRLTMSPTVLIDCCLN